jgi:hypothetical protein
MPVEPAKRAYLLTPSRPAGTATPAGLPGGGIGMDDPLLAERLRRTGLDVSGESAPDALTYRIAAEAEADAEEPGQEEAKKPVDLLLEAQRAEEEKPEEGNPLRELLVTMLLTGIGAMAGYYLSMAQGISSTLPMGTGGTLGLLFGWLCIRWMRPKR